MKTFLGYAVMHREVIERFNRFPDRNDILDRTPTPEEKEYVDQGGPPFWSYKKFLIYKEPPDISEGSIFQSIIP